MTLSHDLVINSEVFEYCLTLEVLAASVGFQIDNGDDYVYDSTVQVTQFLKWRNQMDDNKEPYKTAMCMLELCNRQDLSGLMCRRGMHGRTIRY